MVQAEERDVIKEEWERCGLGQVLSAALQTETMRFCMGESEQPLGEEPHHDADSEGVDGEEAVDEDD